MMMGLSSKSRRQVAVIISSINEQVYTDILDTFLIPLIEKMFGDDIIFHDDDAAFHRTKGSKRFLQDI